MFMAPATGRPSSSVAHGSDHTPPGAAAAYSIMSELATPAGQCSAGTANRPQTLPVASDGTNNGPSSGWTSRRSACSYTAAGTVSSATAFPCAEDRAPFLQPNAPSSAFAVQRQKKPHCLLLSHGSVVDALMRTGTHRSLQTTLHTCNASYAPRSTSLTTRKINHAPSVRNKSSRKQRISLGDGKAPTGKSHHKHHHKQKKRRCRPWGAVDQLTHGVFQKNH
ncbi:regulator of sigma E protease [Trypanosoma cruzi]|nr:regulator of sigma E protease [Trypanosoma cruzi]